MRTILVAVFVGALIVGPFALIFFGSRRYEARQRRLGRWDKYGPLTESEGPRPLFATWLGTLHWGGSMSERLEVVGAWKGRILRRRKPDESPAESFTPLDLPRERDDLWNRP